MFHLLKEIVRKMHRGQSVVLLPENEELTTAAMVDIARVYLEFGKFDQAQAWLTRIPGEETFMASERDALWKELYQKQGDSEKLDHLSAAVADWKECNDHETFRAQILQNHGRKYSFWNRVED